MEISDITHVILLLSCEVLKNNLPPFYIIIWILHVLVIIAKPEKISLMLY